MKQYCVYCCGCTPGNNCSYYCTIHDETLSDSKAKHVNRCKDFVYCDVGHVDSGKQYVPRKPRKRQQCDGQMELNL